MRFLCVALLLVLSFSCHNNDANRTKLIHFTPKNTSIILRTNNIESLKNSINNSDLFKNLSNATIYKNLEDKLENISHLKPSGDILICFSKDKADSLHYTIITKDGKNLFITDSLKHYKAETLTYNKKSVLKSTLKNQTFYSTFIGSVFLVSSSKNIIDAAYNKTANYSQPEKIYNTTTTDKTVSIIIKSGN